MTMLDTAVRHILKTAEIPSFSTFEDRLHPYVERVFSELTNAEKVSVPGNSLVYMLKSPDSDSTVSLAAHLDKINHYGREFPDKLPVDVTETYIEGAMDDCAGVGVLLTIAENYHKLKNRPNLLFFFSEMEESKGLKEHPELLKNGGKGYTHGLGARRISQICLENNIIPEEVITIDTTPLFKGKPGIALYSKHWEFTDLNPDEKLIERTNNAVNRFKRIDSNILLENNTNDFLHYGYEFNTKNDHTVVSVALEPAIYPYHQKGERVFIDDIKQTLSILTTYFEEIA